jgi:nucleoside-diphosphate-sugar epimerase
MYNCLYSISKVIPVIGKAQEVDSWIKYAQNSDIIIEAVADYQDWTTPSIIQKAIAEHVLPKNKNVVVIYTSGVWVYGDTADKVVDEHSPLNPVKLVSARPGIEQSYIDIGAIVLRPGCLYGQSGSLTGPCFFKGAEEQGSIQLFGKPDSSWTLVHAEDLAEGYVLAAKKAPRGQIFNLIGSSENTTDIAHAVLRHVKGKDGEVKHVPPQDPFSEALSLSQKGDSTKAKQVLGWQPRHPEFLVGIERYYNAWKAFQH